MKALVMAMRTQRFGVRNVSGARSSEWVVMWKPNTSDVYLATRTLGGAMKASFHQSGQCHVKAQNPQAWKGVGAPKTHLDMWSIDIGAKSILPFSVVFPEQELRQGEWTQHKPKGTIWVEALPGRAIEIGILLVRATGDVSMSLNAAGWRTLIVDEGLPDGRRLIVAAGDTVVPEDRRAELAAIKSSLITLAEPLLNPRILLVTGANEHGTRMFVDAAAK